MIEALGIKFGIYDNDPKASSYGCDFGCKRSKV